MLDTSQSTTSAVMQRAKGRAHIGVKSVAGQTRISDLHQSGSAKIMVPHAYGPHPEAVFLNTAGGVTGGDAFRFSAALDPGAALTLTTQTAERAYASTGAAGEISVDLTVGQGAHLNWVPQETILFDRSRINRRTRIDLLGNATLLALEIVVLGRAAMGEVPRTFCLTDRRCIFRNGVPVWHDPLEVDGDTALAAAGLGCARAIVTLIYLAPDAEDRRLTLPPGLFASSWDGKLVVRGAFDDLWPLKQALIPVVQDLMTGPLPRVWQT